MPAPRFDDVSEAILVAIEEGNSQGKAAELAGITKRTYWNWIERGKAAKAGKYSKFVDDVEKAKARGQRKLIDHIRATGAEGLFHEETRTETSEKGTRTTKVVKRVVDWRAAAWLLERLDREHWAPPRVEQQVEVTAGGDDRSANLDALRARLREQDEDELELDDE